MCSTCGCSPCNIVQLRRGAPGDDGAPGLPGADGAPGENAQALSDLGVPATTLPSGPTPATAFATYYDGTTGGNVWTWDGTTWTDTGIPVSGINAFTTTTADFPIPIEQNTVLLNVAESRWIVNPGQVIAIEGAGDSTQGGVGYYGAFGYVSPTQLVAKNLRQDSTGRYIGNLITGTVASGSKVSPAGIQGPAGLPMVTSFGAPDPTVAPAGGASGFYIQSGVGGTYWYYNGPSGPWTDTLQPVIGPAGPTGPAGTNGTTPVITRGTATPSLGADGDLHFQFVNPGLIRTWLRAAGVWGYSSANDVVANRMLGFSTTNPTPNPSSISQNAGDQWWTYIGTQVTMYMAVDSATWTVALTFSTGGGGGGADTFQTVSDNSAGQLTGTRVWNMQRSVQYVPFSQNTLAVGATITFNTDYQHHKLTLLHDNAVLAYLDPANDSDEWLYELTNGTAGELNFSYSATMWGANEGVTPPYTVPAGGSVTLVCRWVKGLMVIVYPIQNITTL